MAAAHVVALLRLQARADAGHGFVDAVAAAEHPRAAGQVAVAVVGVVPGWASGPSTSARATCTGGAPASVEHSANAVTVSVGPVIPADP